MAAVSTAQHLADEVSAAVQKADERRKKHKAASVSIWVLTTVFTAGIPILLGLKVNPERHDLLTNIAMVAGGLASILITYEAFYGHKELWAINTAAAGKLRVLASDLAFLRSRNQDSIRLEDLDAMHERLHAIREEHDSGWVRVREATAKQQKPASGISRTNNA